MRAGLSGVSTVSWAFASAAGQLCCAIMEAKC